MDIRSGRADMARGFPAHTLCHAVLGIGRQAMENLHELTDSYAPDSEPKPTAAQVGEKRTLQVGHHASDLGCFTRSCPGSWRPPSPRSSPRGLACCRSRFGA